ncbi:glycosyltransferase family 2 protein [Fusobacterium necrophorum]|nr:glycosyltransferase family 2 protein [Fusobacterium necrophorum]AYZ73036.1 glycosyltransferase family 2 protein [Fusobacterium necrophorum]AZW08964.1 glycosyltransferase family 2 protein [Fusobacterium necrophorum subsp. necrophorum]SDB39695.1 Glycosyltransferase involved in cell wall bisynthesis [Fusobacterium necrophorum]SQD09950.1 Chondroitin polymerase [Fusobacterium necrophorum subsp. necrophorum]
MIKDLVSIITPTYNSDTYISETIDSVINQTYKYWEMIIIDDNSSDNTGIIVKKYTEKYNNIRYILLQRNQGPAIARNIGIESAKGQYIAFLDSDDLWKPNKLKEQINFMKEHNCALSFSQYEEIDSEGNKLNILIKTPKYKISYHDYLVTTPIGCLTAMYDTEKLGKIYLPLLRNREDTALWLKILKKGIYAYPIQKNLAYYRIHSNSITSNKLKLFKYQWDLYFNIEKLGYIKSIFYIFSITIVKILKLKEKRIDA